MVSKERLQIFPIFSRLSSDVLGALTVSMAEVKYSSGDVVFAEGKGGDAAYLVEKGEVLIRKAIDRQKETFKVIALLGPGEIFGEMALLEQAPRSATAIAQSAVTLLRLPSSDFNRVLLDSPAAAMDLSREMITHLSARLRQTTREMVSVFEVGRLLVQGLDVRSSAVHILSLMQQSYEEDVFGAFYYWNEFTSEFDLLSYEGDWPAPLRRDRAKDDLLFHAMSVKKECVLSQDWPRDERFSTALREDWKGLVSLLAAPIVGVKSTLGFILFGHGGRAGIFTTGHRQVLAGISNLVAPALENASWRQEMESKRRLERTRMGAY